MDNIALISIIITILISALAIVISMLQINQNIRKQVKEEMLPLTSILMDQKESIKGIKEEIKDVRENIKDLREDIKDLREDNKALHNKIDLINSNLSSRIDRLADAVWSSKAN